jgi:TrbL/VirB6 plasmid conjugal transfer protein
MTGTGVIDQFLDTYTRYIDSGFGLLGSEVGFLATTLAAIDITLAALFWSWGTDDDLIARLVKKTLFVGVFAYLIGNWNNLARIVFESFAGLGLKASGTGLSSADFLRPGRIAQVGLDAGRPILDSISGLMGYISFFENFVQIVVLLFAWVVVLLAFFILAIQLFVTLIEFKLTTLAGFVLIPLVCSARPHLRLSVCSATSSRQASKFWFLPSLLASARHCSLSSRLGSTAGSRPSKTQWRWCWRRYHCSVSAFSVLGSLTAWCPADLNSGRVPRSGPDLQRAALLQPAPAWLQAVLVSLVERWREPHGAAPRSQVVRPRLIAAAASAVSPMPGSRQWQARCVGLRQLSVTALNRLGRRKPQGVPVPRPGTPRRMVRPIGRGA